MKPQRFAIFPLTLILISTLLTSCGKKGSLFIGTWQLVDGKAQIEFSREGDEFYMKELGKGKYKATPKSDSIMDVDFGMLGIMEYTYSEDDDTVSMTHDTVRTYTRISQDSEKK